MFIWAEIALKKKHSQLSRTCLIGTLAYQEIDEKNRCQP